MEEILTYSSDKLTRLLARLKRKAGDSMTEKFKRYGADEQADFISEEEEWATEFAIREKEGSPVPKEFPRKTYEQYSFTYASLFSGLGGFEQALNQSGGECVFSSEIATFAAQAYEALYSDKPAGDITKIDAKDIPDHDLLVGGFPCQAFSLAGKRKGFEDTRGTLFFDIARIAAEKKPKALLLENVKGLVNHDRGNTLDVMIETLNDIGYVVDFDVLNSKYFGVPQNRERIFIVAIRKDLIEAEPFSEEATKGHTVVPRGKRRISEWASVFNFEWPEQGEVTTRLRDILEKEVDEKYYLDEEKTAKLVAQLEGRENDVNPTVIDPSQAKREGKPRLYQDVAPTVTARDYKEPRMLGHVDIRGNDSIKRTYSTEGISPTLTTMGGGHREPKIAEIQYPLKATCLECRVTYYVDCGCSCDSYVGEDGTLVSQSEVRPVLTPDRMEKRQNGRRFKEDVEESFTLTSQDKHGVAIGNPPKYRIRKLTPLECWRLQGFPDEAHEAVKQAGISDSQRYKQAGNAVTVNVIEAIGERLIPLIN